MTVTCPIRAALARIAPHLEKLDPRDREMLRPAVRAVENAGAQENVITQEPFALWYRVKDAQHMPEGSLHPYSVNLQWCCQNERTDLAEVVALYRGPLPDISDYLDRFGNPKADYKLKLAQPQPMPQTDAVRDAFLALIAKVPHKPQAITYEKGWELLDELQRIAEIERLDRATGE